MRVVLMSIYFTSTISAPRCLPIVGSDCIVTSYMSAGARINHDSEFGRNERDLSYGDVSHADIDDPSALALHVGHYGLWNIEGVTKEDKAQLLASLKQMAETGKDAAIYADDDTTYQEFASVAKIAEFYLSDGENEPSTGHWDRFHDLVEAGIAHQRTQTTETDRRVVLADIIL